MSAIESSTIHAIHVPYEVMKTAFQAYEVAEAMANLGNPNSVSDAGVGALALHASIEGAWLNVKINSAGIKDHSRLKEILTDGEALLKKSTEKKETICGIVLSKIGQI